ncbi:uncharacterized protein K489DRAFT_197033 [Dissoconium aciculare CBS 342.82]|uniref:Uncharacterized protein n=1 Tax=Dissoconium aciculare CBS 342.82 TaxID=1314786 RepID=A0A6J3M621_9PEZI|nr:uncharacterized protein K489DRAFT_197033 [Dissoconium aciculare CBS 342.82]KAF1823480.1 hypothetical protein K489DRAFT_197033 [Dissoconium aciculare CBS 342.82]
MFLRRRRRAFHSIPSRTRFGEEIPSRRFLFPPSDVVRQNGRRSTSGVDLVGFGGGGKDLRNMDACIDGIALGFVASFKLRASLGCRQTRSRMQQRGVRKRGRAAAFMRQARQPYGLGEARWGSRPSEHRAPTVMTREGKQEGQGCHAQTTRCKARCLCVKARQGTKIVRVGQRKVERVRSGVEG